MPSTETLVKIAVLGGPICLGGALFFHRKMQSNTLLYYRPLFETYSKCILAMLVVTTYPVILVELRCIV